MLTLAPFSAVTALVFYEPARWGGAPTFLSLMGMTIFAVITVPMWITYIPSIVITPLVMNKISKRDTFMNTPIFLAMIKAILIGGISGILVLTPAWVIAFSESGDLAMNWLFAGAISGALTLTVIVMLYKLLINKMVA